MSELNTLDIPEDATVFVCSPVADVVKDVIVFVPKTLDKLRELTLPSCEKVTLSGKITSDTAGYLLPGLRKLIIPAGVKNIVFGTALCDTIEEIVMEGTDCVIDVHSIFGKKAITMPFGDAAVDAIVCCKPHGTKRVSGHYSKAQFLIIPEHGIEYYDGLYRHLLASQGKYNSKTNYNYLSKVDTTLVFDSVDDLLGKICDGTFDRILECLSLFTRHSRGSYPISTQLRFDTKGNENLDVIDELSEIYKNCGCSIPIFRIALKRGLAAANNVNLVEKITELYMRTQALNFANAIKAICGLFPEDSELYINLCKDDYHLSVEWHRNVELLSSTWDCVFIYDMLYVNNLFDGLLSKLLGKPFNLNDIFSYFKKYYPQLELSMSEDINDLPTSILLLIVNIYFEIIEKHYAAYLKSNAVSAVLDRIKKS